MILSKSFGRSGLDDQRRFHNRDPMRILALDFGHPLVLGLDHGGMDDGIQLANAAGKATAASLARLMVPSSLRISRPK